MTDGNVKVLRLLKHYLKRGWYKPCSDFLARLEIANQEKEEIQRLLDTLSSSRGVKFYYTYWRLSRKLDGLLEKDRA